jgi:DNA polymerase-1
MTNAAPRLLAIDGLNIVRRVYQASVEPDTGDTEQAAETALRHSLSSFRNLLSAHLPTHVLAAFDVAGLTWRHALFARYREGRTAMPDVLRERLPDFYLKLLELGLHVVQIAEVEADDVIATAVTRWLREGRGAAIIASTDKDLHCLIDDGAQLWDPFKREYHDLAWVESKFGVPPALLPDLLALMGDASDGIPGVSKVGMKTAAKLLRAYGNLDAVMAGAGILPGPLGARLRNERDMLTLSRQLVQLKTDVMLGITWNRLAWKATSNADGAQR